MPKAHSTVSKSVPQSNPKNVPPQANEAKKPKPAPVAEPLMQAAAANRKVLSEFAAPAEPNKVEKPAPVAEPPEEPEEPEEPTPDITDDFAFQYDGDERVKTQKAICSIAYILEWLTEGGNREVEGYILNGFAEVLRHASREVDAMFEQDDIWKTGTDPFKLRKRRDEKMVIATRPDGKPAVTADGRFIVRPAKAGE